MKKITLTCAALCVVSFCKAQSVESILQQVEQNNTVLSAYREQVQADKLGNKVGILPANPEVEFHYLWGNPAETGNRKDFSAIQNFDFPTAYHHKRKVANGKNLQVDLDYRTARNNILLEAKQTAIYWVYYRNLLHELRIRLASAQEIETAYQSRYDKGDINLLTYNKAKINTLNIQQEVNRLETEQRQTGLNLIRLNGQQELVFPTAYHPVQLPVDFEQWLATIQSQNIVLQRLQQETAVNRAQIKLQRSLNLPKISVGYMSERVLTEQFRGVVAGISIPLWENKNTVKQLKAQTIAAQAMEYDAQTRFHNETKALYEKAGNLFTAWTTYKSTLQSANNTQLLKKALDVGEISLIEYITELSIYYETVTYMLETERDYLLTVAELYRWEL